MKVLAIIGLIISLTLLGCSPKPTTTLIPFDSTSTISQQVPVIQTVYITNSGTKYHRAGCRYLAKSSIAISRSSAISKGYEPCKVCNP